MYPFFKFKTPIRVTFEDVDSFRVVHNSKYFCYFERGRLEYFRNLGFAGEGENSHKNFEVAIVENYCSYRKAALFDDLLDIHLRVSFMRNSSFQFQYLVTREGGRILLAAGYSNMVYFNREKLKPRAIPPAIKEGIIRFEGEHLGKMTGIPHTG